MAYSSFEESEAKLNAEREKLQTLKAEWLEKLDQLKKSKEEIKEEGSFAAIEYLKLCDELCKTVCAAVNELDLRSKELKALQNRNQAGKEKPDLFDELNGGMQKLAQEMQQKMQAIGKEYPQLADKTLRRIVDVIAQFSELMEQEQITPNLKAQTNQNLEKELFLEELKSSLESYKKARENFIVESQKGPIEKLAKIEPEKDSVLAKLDTAIAACETALTIQKTID